MNFYGIIGQHLTHSFSKEYFDKKIKLQGNSATYTVFELSGISCFSDFMEKHSNLSGLNVTLPYKKSIMFFLDEIDTEAEKIGAVNVIKFYQENGTHKAKGFNTDVYGFEQSIKPLLHSEHQSALILGNGGASKAVQFVFDKFNIKYQLVSRHKSNSNILLYNELTKDVVSRNLVVVNTTPLGMYPKEDGIPDFPFQFLTSHHLCYDLIYNPEKTKFLELSQSQGASIKNGLEMLHLQADKSWEIWHL